jgi:hypothetical protein
VYTDYGLPWFVLYDENAGDVPLSERLTQVKTIAERDAERGEPTEDEASFEVSAEQTKTLRRDDSGTARGPSSSSATTEHA